MTHEDWPVLADRWRQGEADATPPARQSLEARDAAARRRTGWIRLGGLLLSALILISGARILSHHPDLLGFTLVLPAWLLVAVMWRLAFAGSPRVDPRGETAADFIAIAGQQARSRLRALGTLVILIAVQAVVLLLWAAARFAERGRAPLPPDTPAWLGLGLVAVLALAWALRSRARLRAELEVIDRLREEVNSPT